MGKFRSQIRRSLPLDHVLVVSAEPAGRGDFYEKVPPTPPKTLFAGAEKLTQSWLLAILTFFHPAETKAAFPKDYQREIGSGSLPQVLPAFSKAVGCMGVRVSGGDLCEAEVPTERSETSALGVPTGETQSPCSLSAESEKL